VDHGKNMMERFHRLPSTTSLLLTASGGASTSSSSLLTQSNHHRVLETVAEDPVAGELFVLCSYLSLSVWCACFVTLSLRIVVAIAESQGAVKYRDVTEIIQHLWRIP
jgi:hypothetical protein